MSENPFALADRMHEEPEALAMEIMERWRFAHIESHSNVKWPENLEEVEALVRGVQADIAVLYNLFTLMAARGGA